MQFECKDNYFSCTYLHCQGQIRIIFCIFFGVFIIHVKVCFILKDGRNKVLFLFQAQSHNIYVSLNSMGNIKEICLPYLCQHQADQPTQVYRHASELIGVLFGILLNCRLFQTLRAATAGYCLTIFLSSANKKSWILLQIVLNTHETIKQSKTSF